MPKREIPSSPKLVLETAVGELNEKIWEIERALRTERDNEVKLDIAVRGVKSQLDIISESMQIQKVAWVVDFAEFKKLRGMEQNHRALYEVKLDKQCALTNQINIHEKELSNLKKRLEDVRQELREYGELVDLVEFKSKNKRGR